MEASVFLQIKTGFVWTLLYIVRCRLEMTMIKVATLKYRTVETEWKRLSSAWDYTKHNEVSRQFVAYLMWKTCHCPKNSVNYQVRQRNLIIICLSKLLLHNSHTIFFIIKSYVIEIRIDILILIPHQFLLTISILELDS